MKARGKRSPQVASDAGSRGIAKEVPLWLLVLLVPLAVDPLAKDTFREIKLHSAQILGLASIVLLLWQLRGRDETSSWRDWLASPAIRIAGLILGAAGLSLLATRSWDYSVAALFELSIGVACFAAWSLGSPAGRLRRLLMASILPALVLAVIGALQHHDIWEPFDFSRIAKSERVEVTSLAGASSDLAAFLVLPVLLVQSAMFTKKKWRRLLLPVLVLLSYTLILTQSLTAIGAAMIASAVFWMLSLPRRAFLVRGGAAITFLVVVVLAFSPLRGRLLSIGQVMSEGEINTVLTGRLDGWRAAGSMWRESPVLGVGHGAFRAEFGRTKLLLEGQGEEFFRKHVYSNFSVVHNDYLQALSEWGAVGFLLLTVALALFSRELVRLWRTPATSRDDRAVAVSGSVAMALIPLTYFPWHLALTAYPFLMFAAWILALRSEQKAIAG